MNISVNKSLTDLLNVLVILMQKLLQQHCMQFGLYMLYYHMLCNFSWQLVLITCDSMCCSELWHGTITVCCKNPSHL